jgi:hypothetical protein
VDETYLIQANIYTLLFAIFIKHKDVVEVVTVCGLRDSHTLCFGQHLLIFDASNQLSRPKLPPPTRSFIRAPTRGSVLIGMVTS